jgi:hypothetical protein
VVLMNAHTPQGYQAWPHSDEEKAWKPWPLLLGFVTVSDLLPLWEDWLW